MNHIAGDLGHIQTITKRLGLGNRSHGSSSGLSVPFRNPRKVAALKPSCQWRCETTEPGNSTDYRSGRSLSVIQTNSDQLWWAPDAFDLIWKKEETLALIRKENESEDLAKPRILNPQLSVNSGTLLRTRCDPSLAEVCCSPPDVSPSSFLPWLL